jgi:hypothetical protein
MRNNSKLWMVLAMLAFLLIGFVGGVLCEKYLFHGKPKPGNRRSPHSPTIEMMTEELKLSSQQQDQLREVFRRSDERLKILRKQIHEQYRFARSRLKEEIDAILDKEQRSKFEAMIERHFKKREQEKQNHDKKREKKERGRGDGK